MNEPDTNMIIPVLSFIYNKIKVFSIFVLFCPLVIGCQHNKKVIIAEFNVNKYLLSDSLFEVKNGISIYPPKNWIRTDNYNSELQEKIFNQLNNRFLAIYKSDSSNCALIISELQEADYENIKVAMNKPDSFKKSTDWVSVQPSIFKYKSFEIIQIVFQNSELVIFKLFTRRLSDIYELDYIIPADQINKNIQSVESSIGSIN